MGENWFLNAHRADEMIAALRSEVEALRRERDERDEFWLDLVGGIKVLIEAHLDPVLSVASEANRVTDRDRLRQVLAEMADLPGIASEWKSENHVLNDRMEAAAAEVTRLREALSAERSFHEPSVDGLRCVECIEDWPCARAEQLDAALSAPKEGRNPHSASEDGSNREVSQAGDSVAQSVQESEPGVDRCPTCGSDNRAVWITGTPQNPDRERCPDPWHSAPKEGNER